MSASKAATVFRTHFWDGFAQRQFDRLLAVSGGTDVIVLVDETRGPVAVPHDRVVRVTEESLLAMGLPRAGEGNLLWFNGDYPLYALRRQCPDYGYYFQLEYDVVINRPIASLIAEVEAAAADYVGLTKGEAVQDWFWRDSCAGVYRLDQLRHQLICVSLFSGAALDHLFERRLSQGRALEEGRQASWPFCEGFVPTELALAGFVCRELSEFGDTSAYDHWPPYLEADAGLLAGHTFVHPVLDQRRYVDSLHKYRIGLAGYLNPASLFHRKLRRLPARQYLPVLTRSFMTKARRTIGQGVASLTAAERATR